MQKSGKITLKAREGSLLQGLAFLNEGGRERAGPLHINSIPRLTLIKVLKKCYCCHFKIVFSKISMIFMEKILALLFSLAAKLQSHVSACMLWLGVISLLASDALF